MRWEKIKSYSQRAGKEVFAVAEACFLTMKDPAVPWKHKALLSSALVYLLSPIDAIPDLLPGGFVDDMSLLIAALYTVGDQGLKHLQDCRRKHRLIPPKEEDPNGSIKTPEKK